jgi:cAMP-dependent protein kinase regulator
MDPYERSKIADALVEQKFKKGDFVIKEGDIGDKFFIIIEGEAIATKVL